MVVWNYAWQPGKKTPMHFHDKDTLVVFEDTGALSSTTQDGKVVVTRHFTLADGHVVAFETRTTPARGRELTFLQQLFNATPGVPIGTLPFHHNLAGGTVTGAWSQFNMEAGSDGHFVIYDIPTARNRAANFLQSYSVSATGDATISP